MRERERERERELVGLQDKKENEKCGDICFCKF